MIYEIGVPNIETKLISNTYNTIAIETCVYTTETPFFGGWNCI